MRRLLLLALLFPMLAHAQDKPAKRTCRILFLNPPADAPKKLYLFDGVASHEIQMPEMNFSDVYQLAGGDTTLRLLPAPVVKAEEIPAGAPSGKLAESVVDLYLVASSDPANKVVPVRFQIIDASAMKFRQGQMMWYNLTNLAVGGKLGSQKLAMKGQSRVVTEAPTSGPESYDVELSYQIPGDPQFHPISQTKWVHDPRSRMVMFIYGGNDNSVPQISGFKDFRDAPAKTE
ncbi:MAG: hypothetical protein ABIS50_18620 [Luteolibacter sp.]|uniref:hypothetical protein n=1 Tax=Luteolibacter sp. TaxID=1962973 RepID=UPI0032654F5C